MATPVSPMAQQLMRSMNIPDVNSPPRLELKEIDAVSDHEMDEPTRPVHGGELLLAGKYGKNAKDRLSMAEVYLTKKDYVKWVRAHIQTDAYDESIKRFRLYIELRDGRKKERLGQERQMPVMMTPPQNNVPPMPRMGQSKAMAKPRAKASVEQYMMSTPPRMATYAMPEMHQDVQNYMMMPGMHQGYPNYMSGMPGTSGRRRRDREGEGWIQQYGNSMEAEWEEIEDITNSDLRWSEFVQRINQQDRETALNMMRVVHSIGRVEAMRMFR